MGEYSLRTVLGPIRLRFWSHPLGQLLKDPSINRWSIVVNIFACWSVMKISTYILSQATSISRGRLKWERRRGGPNGSWPLRRGLRHRDRLEGGSPSGCGSPWAGPVAWVTAQLFQKTSHTECTTVPGAEQHSAASHFRLPVCALGHSSRNS